MWDECNLTDSQMKTPWTARMLDEDWWLLGFTVLLIGMGIAAIVLMVT